MQVIYIGPHPEVRLPNGVLFPNGEPVEVDDVTGRGLVRQPGFTARQRRRPRQRVETPERPASDVETREADAEDRG